MYFKEMYVVCSIVFFYVLRKITDLTVSFFFVLKPVLYLLPQKKNQIISL